MRKLFAVLSLCAIALPLAASAPYQVADLRTTPHTIPSSYPVFVADVNGAALFTTFDEERRNHSLWRSDGTAAGTQRLVEFASSERIPALHLRVAETVYFPGYVDGRQSLWKTDGTVAGTTRVVNLGTNAETIQAVGVLGERVFFTRGTRELWVADAQGAMRLAEVFRQFGTSRFTFSAVWNGHVYVGNEAGLWKSDGTASGTMKLAGPDQAWGLTVSQDRLFFVGYGLGTTGAELWTTDGTAAGTRMVQDFGPGPESTFTLLTTTLAPLNGGVLWFGHHGELGFSDGTTMRLFRTGAPVATYAPRVAMLNGIAYFGFDDGVHGRELWRSDGTENGTFMVVDTSSGPEAEFDALTVAGSKLYYIGSTVEHPHALFESDGTAAGTRAIHDLRAAGLPGSNTLGVAGGKVLFRDYDEEHGLEPWVVDEGGARLLANVAAEDPGSSDPNQLLAHGRLLYFIADDDLGPALWRTDGTAAGTELVVRNESRGALPDPFVSFDNTLYLRDGDELRKIEGESGTDVLVKRFTDGNDPGSAVVTGGRLFFRAGSGDHQLWTTDGTEAGTVEITNLDEYYDDPLLPVTLAGRHYFTTSRGQLHATDGTPGGDRLIVDAASEYGPYSNLIAFGPSLYYLAAEGLRKFSGEAADATDFSSFPRIGAHVAVARDAIFFGFDPYGEPGQLWKSDGTSGGTELVRQFAATAYGDQVKPVSLGDRVVFGVDDGEHGIEPWVSHGTYETTQLLRDISSGSSAAQEFFVADGIAYFAATDEVHGRELWQTDGTPEGTKLVADIYPGTASSSPEHFTRAGDTLYFSARSASGRELWAYELPGHVTVTLDDARASESAGSIAVTVRLTRPSAQPVGVDYHTADDTAKAGQDYTASSGRLTFAPGETVKTVTIPIANDSAPGSVRGFFIRLTNANVAFERAVAGGIIEDDDVAVDLVLSLEPYGEGARLRVENAGPSTASDVVLCHATPPTGESFQCTPPFILKAGQSQLRDLEESDFGSGAIVAKVTQWERDRAPASNASRWSVADRFEHVLYVQPTEPRVGELVTITVTARGVSNQPRQVRLISSWYRVITLPQTVTIPANEQSVTITAPALESGVVIIAIDEPTQAHGVTVFVYGPSTPIKATPILKWEGENGDWGFGPVELTLQVSGLTVDGQRPTGTVEFTDRYAGGAPLGTVPVRDGIATLRITPRLGQHQFSVRYSGDANFAAHEHLEYLEIDVVPGPSRIRAERIPGTNDLLVTVIGVDGYPPTGTIAVEDADHSENRRAGPLTPADSSRSTFIATGLANARTVYVDYRGDQHYAWETGYIDFGRTTKRRGVRK